MIVSFPGLTNYLAFCPSFETYFIFGNHLIEEEIVFVVQSLCFLQARSGFLLFLPTYKYNVPARGKDKKRKAAFRSVTSM